MKKSSRDSLNLFFSSFLVIGFIVCTYFFMSLTTRVEETTASVIKLIVYILFGLLLFYATRVGDGIPVKRFSLVVLLVLDLPALFIIIASLAPNFPLHTALASQEIMMVFASVALGYGIPYTFLSGFEMKAEEAEEEAEEVVKGGIEEELKETSEQSAEEAEVAEAEVAEEAKETEEAEEKEAEAEAEN